MNAPKQLLDYLKTFCHTAAVPAVLDGNELTESAAYELKEENSNVTVSALCPGPVDTEFNRVAGVHFSVRPLTSKYVAKYAVINLIKGKTVIVPGLSIKLAAAVSKVVPSGAAAGVTAKIQKRKAK